MTQQQYTPDEARAVAAGLRLVTAGRFTTADEAADCIDELADRIERPVPTTDEHEPIDTLNLGYYRTRVQCSCGRSWWFGEHEGDPTHDEAKIEHEQPSPHPPTREQIDSAVGAVLFNASNYPRSAMPQILGQDIGPLRNKVTNAVLALIQNGADRG